MNDWVYNGLFDDSLRFEVRMDWDLLIFLALHNTNSIFLLGFDILT